MLSRITWQDFGLDAQRWADWIRQNRKAMYKQSLGQGAQVCRSEGSPIRFALLTAGEAEGADVDWAANLSLTEDERAALPLRAGDEARRGRLRRAFTAGSRDSFETFQRRAIVLVDKFGLVLIQCSP